MNTKQRVILLGAAALIATMLLFPPFFFHYGADVERETNLGYHFILHSPLLQPSTGPDYANVQWAVLLTQWVGVVLIAAMLWLAARD